MGEVPSDQPDAVALEKNHSTATDLDRLGAMVCGMPVAPAGSMPPQPAA
jgi:hypothetical protein